MIEEQFSRNCVFSLKIFSYKNNHPQRRSVNEKSNQHKLELFFY